MRETGRALGHVNFSGAHFARLAVASVRRSRIYEENGLRAADGLASSGVS